MLMRYKVYTKIVPRVGMQFIDSFDVVCEITRIRGTEMWGIEYDDLRGHVEFYEEIESFLKQIEQGDWKIV